jgi:hypothetical protein
MTPFLILLASLSLSRPTEAATFTLEQLNRWILPLDAVSQGDEETAKYCKASGEQAKRVLATLHPLWEQAVDLRASRAKRRQTKQWSKVCQKDPCSCLVFGPVTERLIGASAEKAPSAHETLILNGSQQLTAEARLSCARKFAKAGACRSPAFRRQLTQSQSLDAPSAH